MSEGQRCRWGDRGWLFEGLSRAHGLEIADALLAATARRHGLRFWTMNKEHYPMADIVFFEG